VRAAREGRHRGPSRLRAAVARSAPAVGFLLAAAFGLVSCASPFRLDERPPLETGSEARAAPAVSVPREKADEERPSPARRVDRENRPEPSTPRGRILLTVGGRPVERAALADVFLYFFREEYYKATGYLVEREIIAAEARRLGVTVGRTALERAVSGEIDLQRREVAVQFAGEVAFEDFLRDNFKLDLGAYRERVAEVVGFKLLRDRVARFSRLRDGYADVRKIVVLDEAVARDIRDKVIEGADFEVLARKHSASLSRAEGGLLEGMVRGALGPGIDEAVFALGPGEVSEVIPVVEEGRTQYHLYRVVRRVAGRPISWSEARDEVLADLIENPVSQLEVLAWTRAAGGRYPVEYVTP